MRIVISPAKTMKEFAYDYGDQDFLPRYQKETMRLYEYMRAMDLGAMQSFCRVSERLAQKCLLDYANWSFDEMGSPAMFSYHGIQYLALDPLSFNEKQCLYANTHVRILSGLYGSLRPLDCVYPYRLEMQAPVQVGKYKDLYEYWKDIVYEDLQGEMIIDLASKEYSDVIDKRLKASKQYLQILFYVEKNGKRVAISTAIKAARGAMLHEIIKQEIEDIDLIKQICVNGFVYDEVTSTKQCWVFVKEDHHENISE